VDEETNRIRQHIESEREQLGWDLDEIESRVKNATDLKAKFDKNTGLILGAAVAGGLLLSVAFRKTSPSSTSSRQPDARERSASTATPSKSRVHVPLERVSETLDTIFEGLIGVVSDKLYSFVADAVPGFRTQYDAIERQRGRSSVYRMRPDLGAESDLTGTAKTGS